MCGQKNGRGGSESEIARHTCLQRIMAQKNYIYNISLRCYVTIRMWSRVGEIISQRERDKALWMQYCYYCFSVCWLEQKTMEVSISQTLRFLSLLSTDTDFYILSAELDFIPSTRLGFRRAVPEFLRRPFAFAFVADRVIKSGLKSQSNPPTMRRMRATICESRRGDRRTACNTFSVELIRDPLLKISVG